MANRRSSDRDFAAAVKARVADMERLTRRLGKRSIDLDEWADAFHAVLVRGHTDAYVLGRQRAGDLAAETDADARFGLGAADGQDEFLQNWLEQLKAGDERYFGEDGEILEDAFNVRARQYASRMRGTANEAFVDAGEPDDEYDWDLGPAEHCPDCLDLHDLGPYRPGAFISYPGDGQTECKANCHCRLTRRRDKVAGFARVDVYIG